MNLMTKHAVNWRWIAAASVFLCGFIGFGGGVQLSATPQTELASVFTRAYYTLGLFVVGGLDIGVPTTGPWWARTLLWTAYFGAPLLTATAVIETIVHLVAPTSWQFRNLRGHIIVMGSSDQTLSYLRLLQKRSPRQRVVVVDSEFDPIREQELQENFAAIPVVGDLSHHYLLEQLRIKHARRVILLGHNDFQGFEAATRVLEIAPNLEREVILHVHNLRFMRSVQNVALVKRCITFNTYNVAATAFVHGELVHHFAQTVEKDTVVLAGFGRFGQSVLEELYAHAADAIRQVAVIDRDADRRILVVDEQQRIRTDHKRRIYEGDISHPRVWEQLGEDVDLARDRPTIVLGTGQEQDNLRAAIWIKSRYPNAEVYTRTSDISQFALDVGREHGIKSISITRLVEESIPEHWLR